MIQSLETKNLRLRKAKKDDLEFIFKNIWSDQSIAKNMLWEITDNLEDAVKRMERTIKYQKENYAYFVCLKQTDEPIGFAGVFEKESNIYEERGICIAKKHQGKGYGKEVLSVLKELIFEKLNGEKFVYSCFNTNENSRKLCISQGFKYFKSTSEIREYDGMQYIADYYYFDKEMYEKEINKYKR